MEYTVINVLNVQPTVCWSPTCWYMVAGATGGCSPKSMELQATRFFLDSEILPYFWSSSMSEPSFSASHTPQWSKTGKTVCKSPVIIDNSPLVKRMRTRKHFFNKVHGERRCLLESQVAATSWPGGGRTCTSALISPAMRTPAFPADKTH